MDAFQVETWANNNNNLLLLGWVYSMFWSVVQNGYDMVMMYRKMCPASGRRVFRASTVIAVYNTFSVPLGRS